MLEKNIQQKIRLEWVDVLRALAILFVVYGHRVPTVWFSAFFNPIKMPLFFALSGYLFHIKPGGDIVYFKKTLKSLIIPWLFLGLVPLLLSLPLMGLNHTLNSIVKLFTGDLLWFMPCFIIAQIIFYYVIKLTKNYLILVTILIIIISAIGYILRQKEILNTCMVNVAMMVQFYFYIGYLYKKYENTFRNHRLTLGITLLMSYLIIAVIFYPLSGVDVHNGAFACLPIGLVMTVIGLLCLFMLSSLITHLPKFLLTVGKNSLVIYMLDRYVLLPFMSIYNFANPPAPYYLVFFVALLYLVYTSTINIYIAKILNKYIPWSTGGRG